MSSARLERLLNLTIALMATRRPLTVADLAATVYGGADLEDEAFRRMFERDKEALREQGIPVVTEPTSVWDDSDVGYRIRRADYALPDLRLDPDEVAALGLAARLWSSATLAEGVTSALRKLEAVGAGAPAADDLPLALTGAVDASDPALEPLLAATRARQAVAFPYQGPRDPEPRERHVEPWGVVAWHGRWYVVGHDRDRGAERVFRLGRVTGPVRAVGRSGAFTPPEVDLTARVAASQPAEPAGEARLAADPGAGWALRRRALRVEQGAAPGGRDLVVVPLVSARALAEQLAPLAPGVIALEPPALVEEVRQRLAAALAEHRAEQPGGVTGVAGGVPA